MTCQERWMIGTEIERERERGNSVLSGFDDDDDDDDGIYRK